MKKTIFLTLLAGSSCAVFAQSDSLHHTYNQISNPDSMKVGNNMGNTTWSGDSSRLNSSTTYNAYGTYTATAPDYVQGYVLRDYPMATDLHWQQNNDWWHAYYLNGAQPTHVYYNNSGQSFIVSLPVKQSLIPDDVTSRAIQTWGPEVYDIIALKGTTGQDIYQVRILENGQVSSQYMDAGGNKVIDVYREDSGNAALGNMPSGTSTNTDVHANSIQVNTNNQSTDMNTGSTEAIGTDMNNTGKLKIKTKTSDGKKSKTKIVNGKVISKSGE